MQIRLRTKTVSFIALLLLMGSTSLWGQSKMTDEEIKENITTLNNRGLSRIEIYAELKKKGVTNEQLTRLYNQNKSQIEGASNTSSSHSSQTRTRTITPEVGNSGLLSTTKENSDSLFLSSTKPTTTSRKIFGHDVFNNKNLTFQSSMNLATPQSYVLGPGDVVNIDVWGNSQESITETISPDGTITISGIGVIQLGGLTVSQAKARLRSEIGNRYQGSRIELTLGQTRSITVNVMGEVKTPGTYTMSAFSTVYNALYMAGGPNAIGTLRNVKVYRKGKLLSNVDVYDFLLNGRLTGDVRLQDNDIITVSPYEALVCISGKVKRPMFYEMKNGESAATLLNYAGGFTGDAFTKAIRINRKAGDRYSVFNVSDFDMSQFKLMDEDSVSIDATLTRYENMVELKGAAFRPGMYQLGGSISTVKSLIESAGGLQENAIGQHAVIHRRKTDRSLEMLSIDINSIIEGTTPDVPLRNEDVLYIASNEEQQQERVVTIHGEVRIPGIYQYAENATIEDLIIQAGGLTEAASITKIDVARRLSDPEAVKSSNELSQIFSFKIDKDLKITEANDFRLQPFDEIYVRRSPIYSKQQNIVVEGEVEFEGTYALSNKDQRLSDVIAMAGGLTGHAYAKGAKLLRRMTDEERDQLAVIIRTAQRNTGKDSIDVNKLFSEGSYRVAIELDKALKKPGTEDDPVLRQGDRIIIPRYNNTVSINGEVLYPNTVQYKEGLTAKDYIEQAGGCTNSAKKSKTIIIYANGYVAKANSKHRPDPGCQIVVPSKRSSRPFSLGEILSVGTSTASLATMIVTLSNILNK